jgi:hypothetical protein
MLAQKHLHPRAMATAVLAGFAGIGLRRQTEI